VPGEESNQNNPTAIVCKYFIEAVEKRLYGWFWSCPSGPECKYKHKLPEGYLLKSEMRDLLLEQRQNRRVRAMPRPPPHTHTHTHTSSIWSSRRAAPDGTRMRMVTWDTVVTDQRAASWVEEGHSVW